MTAAGGSSGALERRRRAAEAGDPEGYRSKQREVVRVAAEVFQEKGFNSATLRDVADGLGMDRATLYLYIDSKDELLRAIVEQLVLDLADEVRRIAAGPRTAAEKLGQVIHAIMDTYASNRPFAFVFLNEHTALRAGSADWMGRLDDTTADIQLRTEAIIDDGMRRGEFRADIPARLIAHTLFGMTNWSYRWFKPGDQYSGEVVGESFARLLLNGLTERAP